MIDSVSLVTLVEELWARSEGGTFPAVVPLHGGCLEVLIAPRPYGCALWAECGGEVIARANMTGREIDPKGRLAAHVRAWIEGFR